MSGEGTFDLGHIPRVVSGGLVGLFLQDSDELFDVACRRCRAIDMDDRLTALSGMENDVVVLPLEIAVPNEGTENQAAK